MGKASRFLNPERRGRAAPQRPQSTLTSARLRVNRDERAAKLRSILQLSEEVMDGNELEYEGKYSHYRQDYSSTVGKSSGPESRRPVFDFT
ncbi:hypothetical protein EVAR_29878_1 [Eumeta japonica]|uniref:Uncharacterized protein n=1 Tax=Eumeta variegata TaxID=151549 RepID=A0A4C1V6Q3_EUMVA|nr:hypothetical protein EVAR_29878_1 [Eumeta japonica]